MAFNHLLMAYVMIELGEYHQASEHIDDAFSKGSQVKSSLFKSYALLMEAQSALDQMKPPGWHH